MRRLRAWVIRLAGTFRRSSRDRDLAEELNSHLQLHIDDNLRAGMVPEEARRQAVLALGGLEGAKEAYRDDAACRRWRTCSRTFATGSDVCAGTPDSRWRPS